MKRVVAIGWLLVALSAFSPNCSAQTRSQHPSAEVADVLTTLEQANARMLAQDWKAAIPLWEKLVQRNPVRGGYWNQLATAYYNDKNYNKAIPAYEKSLRLGIAVGSKAELVYNIGRCYAQLGEKNRALDHLEKAFAMGLSNLEAAQNDGDLKSLQIEPRFQKLIAAVDTSKMGRVEGWRYDLSLLAREVKRKAFFTVRRISEAEFDLAVKKLDAEIPRLNDWQITIEMMKLVAKIGDGHTWFLAGRKLPEVLKLIPIDIAFFSEGLFITAADSRYEELLGSQILRLGDKTVDEVMIGLDPIIHRDNDEVRKVFGPIRMRNIALLHALGLIPEPERVALTVIDREGKSRKVTISAEPGGPILVLRDGLPNNWKSFHQTLPGTTPLYLKKMYEPNWFEYLPEVKTVYFQFNRVMNNPQESLEAFCARLFKFINENDVEKLIVDMRWNYGGDATISPALIHGLISAGKINKRGRLFVVIGPRTYSAAQITATKIEQHTNAIFVGEPTGSSPNFIGEEKPFTLPYSKIRANVSDLYWQDSWPDDFRTSLAPTVYIQQSFEAYRNNRDTALEAILAYRELR